MPVRRFEITETRYAAVVADREVHILTLAVRQARADGELDLADVLERKAVGYARRADTKRRLVAKMEAQALRASEAAARRAQPKQGRGGNCPACGVATVSPASAPAADVCGPCADKALDVACPKCRAPRTRRCYRGTRSAVPHLERARLREERVVRLAVSG